MSQKDDFERFIKKAVGFAAGVTAFLKYVPTPDISHRKPQHPEEQKAIDFLPYSLPTTVPPQNTVKPYQAYASPYGGLVVLVGNHQIGSAFDSPAYKASIDKFGKWMTEPQLEVALALEDRVRETRKHLGPRVNSGLDAHSHIVRNFAISLENAIAADVRPDYVTPLTAIAIDLVEDHPDVIQLNKDWEKAIINFDEQGRIRIEKELRAAIYNILTKTQGYLTKIVKRMRINGDYKRELIGEIKDVVKLTGHNTRHPWEKPYPLSMAFQFDKKGNERPAIVLARMGSKIADRTSNNEDIGPVFSYEEFMELQKACADNSIVNDQKVGEYLREKYGEFRSGSYMPAAVRVGNGVSNLSILHFLNQTLDNITSQIQPGSREDELLRWVEYSKIRMLKSALGLATSASNWYEVFLPLQFIDFVNERVERRKRSNYYNAVTPDGFFMEWVGYDIAGRRFIESFDTSPQRRAETYEVARDLEVAIPMFGMFFEKGRRDDDGKPFLITNPKVKFDPTEHERLKLDGMEDRLKDVQGVNYRNMARRWLPYKYDGKNGV